MRAIIWSLICKVLVIIAVLIFVFAIVWLTNNTKFLWLLWLILSVWLIPSYEINRDNQRKE